MRPLGNMTLDEIKHECSLRSDWLDVYGMEELEWRERYIEELEQKLASLTGKQP